MATLFLRGGISLAAISAFAYAADTRGQEFQPQPLPSFYAGQPVGETPGEVQTASSPPVMLVQDSRPRQAPWDAGKPDRRPAENAPAAGPDRRPPNSPDAPRNHPDVLRTAGDAPAAQLEDGRYAERVYDGLPVDGRPGPRAQGPQQHGPQPPPRPFRQPPHAMAPTQPHPKNSSEVERMLQAGVMKDFLALMKENFELKSQLKIQQIEFEAQQRILMIEREAERQRHDGEQLRREAERRIDELQAHNTELQRAQRQADERVEQQSHGFRSEMQELRQLLEERNRELERAQRSRAELEHRARAFEAQLEQLKARPRIPFNRGGTVEEEFRERIESRERERERNMERERNRERERERERERDIDREHDSEREQDEEREQEMEREQAEERERDIEREHDFEREQAEEREQDDE